MPNRDASGVTLDHVSDDVMMKNELAAGISRDTVQISNPLISHFFATPGTHLRREKN
jgi:hypothetical protein